ncbi:carboxylate--amine ligase [Acetilactobacillus jinshanensis]|uniref:Carboxylate--amine ligase n=1 Tax=Acetilactobacillus jinshanensis TaxID=1720083 RepID=A0A4P6ZM63_9LACO|nr:carboxylate--amine ligase [Acetilactobacillus jinshanensis]QBP18703.1 carboxylate--amine ligase [Acetilactobacillus jinshanensis]URL61578.1 carboxylate--amine ligase [uncultured bacterium]
MNKQPKFTVILLGSDFNVYGMARSLYSKYGQPIKAYAQRQFSPTRFTKIVNLTTIPGFASDPVWIQTMRKLKKKYASHKEPVILIGCSDGYAELISKHKDELSDVFDCPYVDYKEIKQLNDKENFYHVCDKYHLPYPKTQIITRKMYDDKSPIKQPFGYPVELKPANSVEWLKIQFKGRRKTFTIKSEKEFRHIVYEIYSHGYQSDLILQDFIPGDDSNMRVLNAYVDKYHKVRMMCLGHPLLEDCTPSQIGNYVAILPEYNKKIYDTVKKFLEAIKFVGYANFDIKFDRRDDSFKVFEINLRQGRSSFYVSLNGYNLADWAVQDYAFDSLKGKPCVYANKDPKKYMLWLGVGKNVFKHYTKDSPDKRTAMKLIKEGRYGRTFWYRKDRNFHRWLLLKWIDHNYTKNFEKYFALTKE